MCVCVCVCAVMLVFSTCNVVCAARYVISSHSSAALHQDRNTTLHRLLATTHSLDAATEYLVRHGADPNARNMVWYVWGSVAYIVIVLLFG